MIVNFLKEHYIIFIVSVFIFIILSPSLGLDLTGNDWNNFDYIVKNFGHGFLPFKIPLSFYFTQYGTLYASIAYAMQFLGTDPTLHYLNNIFLRIVASSAIYLLVSWWSRRKVAGIIAGIFFGISYPGMESTIWSVHFLTYISVILLCIFLYFWKRFHDFPTKANLYYSIILFGLTIFIAHIKIFALPLLVLIGEFYALVASKRHRGLFRLKIIHSLFLLVIFLVLYFGTTIMKPTPELSGKILHPYVILQSLINGYPPLIQSLFLFISNLVISPDLLKLLENINILTFNQFSVSIVTAVMTLLSLIFFVYLFKRRQYRLSLISLIAIIFPISVYFSSEMLKIWETTWIISNIVGGTLFILIFIGSFVIWKNNKRILELVVLSNILLISHLLIPWLAFTQFEIDTQSAFHFYSRYYTVPAMGMGIIWGLLFTYAFDLLIGRTQRFSLLRFNSYKGLVTIILIVFLFILHSLQTQMYIKDFYQYFDKFRHEQLWKLISPHLIPFAKDPLKKSIYIEGDLSSKDLGIVYSYFPYQLYVNYEQSPHSLEHNFIFLTSKVAVLDLLRGESFNPGSLIALRINNGQVKDIKDFLIQESKNEK